jgi:hypothetical protein
MNKVSDIDSHKLSAQLIPYFYLLTSQVIIVDVDSSLQSNSIASWVHHVIFGLAELFEEERPFPKIFVLLRPGGNDDGLNKSKNLWQKSILEIDLEGILDIYANKNLNEAIIAAMTEQVYYITSIKNPVKDRQGQLNKRECEIQTFENDFLKYCNEFKNVENLVAFDFIYDYLSKYWEKVLAASRNFKSMTVLEAFSQSQLVEKSASVIQEYVKLLADFQARKNEVSMPDFWQAWYNEKEKELNTVTAKKSNYLIGLRTAIIRNLNGNLLDVYRSICSDAVLRFIAEYDFKASSEAPLISPIELQDKLGALLDAQRLSFMTLDMNEYIAIREAIEEYPWSQYLACVSAKMSVLLRPVLARRRHSKSLVDSHYAYDPDNMLARLYSDGNYFSSAFNELSLKSYYGNVSKIGPRIENLFVEILFANLEEFITTFFTSLQDQFPDDLFASRKQPIQKYFEKITLLVHSLTDESARQSAILFVTCVTHKFDSLYVKVEEHSNLVLSIFHPHQKLVYLFSLALLAILGEYILKLLSNPLLCLLAICIALSCFFHAKNTFFTYLLNNAFRGLFPA